MISQTISETGFIIGTWDPKDEHGEIRDAMILEPIAKAAKSGPEVVFDEANKRIRAYTKRLRDDLNKPAPKTTGQKLADRAGKVVLDSSGKLKPGAKAALVIAPAAAVAAANSDRIKAGYTKSRDTRHYRPASMYYDDGFGKAAEEILSKRLGMSADDRIKRVDTKAARLERRNAANERMRSAKVRQVRGGPAPARAFDSAILDAKKVKSLLPSTKEGKIAAAVAVPATVAATRINKAVPGFGAARSAARKAGANYTKVHSKVPTWAKGPAAGKTAILLADLAAAGYAKRRAGKAAAAALAAKNARRARNMNALRQAAPVAAVAVPAAVAASRMSRGRESTLQKGLVSGAKNLVRKPLPGTNTSVRDIFSLSRHDPAAAASAASSAGANITGRAAKLAGDISGDIGRATRNARSISDDLHLMRTGKKRVQPGMSTGQKLALGGAGVGGLMIGRQLTGPKPYPYQQQR